MRTAVSVKVNGEATTCVDAIVFRFWVNDTPPMMADAHLSKAIVENCVG